MEKNLYIHSIHILEKMLRCAPIFPHSYIKMYCYLDWRREQTNGNLFGRYEDKHIGESDGSVYE